MKWFEEENGKEDVDALYALYALYGCGGEVKGGVGGERRCGDHLGVASKN